MEESEEKLMNASEKPPLERATEKILFVSGQIIPVIVLIGVLAIFCAGVVKLCIIATLVEVYDKQKSMTPILWSSGKSMLIFTAVGLILMTTLHMVKFALYVQVEDVLDAIILSAYAITLMGVHRGIDILLMEQPLRWATFTLFGFLVVGGAFVTAILFVKTKLETRPTKK